MIDALVYGEGSTDGYDDLGAARGAAGTTWVRATEATPAELREVGDVFGIHELELEDVENGVRPKVDVFEDHLFVLAKTARLRRGETTIEEEVRDDPVGLFVGEDWVVTASPADPDPVERVWEAVGRREPRLLARGPDFTAYRVLDELVTGYFAAVDEVETDIERVEDDVMAAPEIDTLEAINSLRRELLSLRRVLWPSRDAMAVWPVATSPRSSPRPRSTTATSTTGWSSWST
jgi:magnesium transporter